SYVMSDILAAFLYAQLERWSDIQQKRASLWSIYRHQLSDWAQSNDIGLPVVPAHCQQAYHMFYLLLPSLEKRQAFITHLAQHGIQAVFHYLPLHLSSYGRRWGRGQNSCPVTENISARLVRLPFYNSMDEATQEEVISTVRSFQ
ncbi:MAG: DegT/DnrJ/EryC1/StrS family aminotransferase, partial [Opitutaceae bacterium]|nr:DegT/DnrJ/EryC1/StrS family aminotransferase [Opitutaceae bacterium]